MMESPRIKVAMVIASKVASDIKVLSMSISELNMNQELKSPTFISNFMFS